MLNPDISSFENSVNLDQLASQKPADHDPHCFQLYLRIYAYKEIGKVDWKKNWEESSI